MCWVRSCNASAKRPPVSGERAQRYSTPATQDETTMGATMQQKACDQCYSRKKRCLIRSGSSSCVRCEKSSLPCTIVRHQARPGRPPKRGLAGVSRSSLGIWDYSLSEASPEEGSTKSQSPRDQDALSGCPSTPTPPCLLLGLQVEDFYTLSDIYMFGFTFARDFQRALEYCHHHSPDLLDEIFIAMKSCLSWARFNLLTADQVDIGSGAASVDKLRNAVISHPHDAIAVLMLGQALAAFDSLVTSTGTVSILRCSLSLVKPWYPDIAAIQFLEPIAIAPIFWDTLWCLLYREVPVIRPFFGRAAVIDRIAGLCTSLLPILYDLCVVSRQMRDGTVGEKSLDDIEEQIVAWCPDDSGLSLETYTELEISSMRTQATMYRKAGLLLIHRLRHPLTCKDSTAQVLANDILETRNQFFSRAGAGAKLQSASFPLFLALLEVPVSPEGVWESTTRLRSRTACVDRLVAFHNYFWEQRHSGFNGSIFEMIGNGPEFVPVP